MRTKSSMSSGAASLEDHWIPAPKPLTQPSQYRQLEQPHKLES